MSMLRGGAGRWLARLGTVVATLALVACGGGGGGGDEGQGTLRFSMTDEPSCHEHVWVTVRGIGVHASGSAGMDDAGWRDLALATPKRVDLRTLTNGVLEELGSMPLPAGRYSQLRLVLAENAGSQDPPANAVQVAAGGPVIALQTPSGQQSGLKLQVHFTVEANRLVDLVLDFDACRSVVQAGQSGRYLLKPVVRVSPKFVAGIEGYVATTAPGGVVVTAQQNGGTVVRSTTPDPATGRFLLAFLGDGAYNVVITAPDRATRVVTGVPATSTGTATVTALNAPASAIVLPPSAMGSVAGTVTSGAARVVDATVSALQSAGASTFLVASRQTGEAGTYSFSLPLAAPLVAPYGPTLAFAPAAGTAGVYTLQSSSPSLGTKSQGTTLGTTSATVDFQH